MPELPEVETVRRGLEQLAPPGTRIAAVVAHRPDLRFPLPARLSESLADQAIRGFRRHGKYLLWDLEEHILLSHLGMSGSWRATNGDELRVHDHVEIVLEDGRRLTYHDPRRFGFIELLDRRDQLTHSRLRDLGPDALDDQRFTVEHLRRALAHRRAPIKATLLDQRVVAGIGNIYACEALFRARIGPRVAAHRISRPRLQRLVEAVRSILEEAIDSGGSTLRDYRQTGGETGYFQHRFAVYGRDGEPCLACEKPLRGAVVAGRATVWCGDCQRS